MNKSTYEIDFGGPIGICSEHRIKAISLGVLFGRLIRPVEKTGLKGLCPLCWSEANQEKIDAVVRAGEPFEVAANRLINKRDKPRNGGDHGK